MEEKTTVTAVHGWGIRAAPGAIRCLSVIVLGLAGALFEFTLRKCYR
jgi:hypothetical protein